MFQDSLGGYERRTGNDVFFELSGFWDLGFRVSGVVWPSSLGTFRVVVGSGLVKVLASFRV